MVKCEGRRPAISPACRHAFIPVTGATGILFPLIIFGNQKLQTGIAMRGGLFAPVEHLCRICRQCPACVVHFGQIQHRFCETFASQRLHDLCCLAVIPAHTRVHRIHLPQLVTSFGVCNVHLRVVEWISPVRQGDRCPFIPHTGVFSVFRHALAFNVLRRYAQLRKNIAVVRKRQESLECFAVLAVAVKLLGLLPALPLCPGIRRARFARENTPQPPQPVCC